VLAAVGLERSYGVEAVLRGADISIQRGEIVSLLGRNGAGKTTLLSCLSGQMRPGGGSILLNEAPASPADLLERVALIPEIPQVYPGLTVWDHLQFIATARGVREWPRLARELLERFQMERYADRVGNELSKGTRQKLLIACAGLAKAEYLLLDEPLVGLDPIAQEDFYALVKELARDDSAILLSTHNIDFALRAGNRIVTLSGGITKDLPAVPDVRAEIIAAIGNL
jgi:ABC-2 type transport system ATP-binding protein